MENQRVVSQGSLGQVFLREIFRAGAWGVVLVIVFFIFLAGMRSNIKNAIDFTIKQSVIEMKSLAYDKHFFHGVKKNIKKGIEFAATTTKKEFKGFIDDKDVQQNIKDAIDFWYGYEHKYRQPTSPKTGKEG